MEPSRNDPCPCGSGKKYKKCCMQSAEPAAAAQPRDRLLGALQEGRFTELLCDAKRFDDAVSTAMRGLEGRPPTEALETIFERAAPVLWPSGLGETAKRFAREALLAGNEADRTTWTTLQATAEQGEASQNAVARVLFGFQFERWGRELKRSFDSLDSARATVQEAMRLAGEIDGDRPLLAFDEWAWLSAVLQPQLVVLAEASEAEARAAREELARLLQEKLEPALVEAVIARAKQLAEDPATAPELAAWYRRARAMLETFPAPVILGAHRKFAVVCVTELEAEDAFLQKLLEQSTWSSASLEPYRQFLLEQQATEAAARIARAQAALG